MYTALPMICAMAARTTLFKSKRLQAVRLPQEVAFADRVSEVVIRKAGKARLIVPADASWDDFFDAPGVELGRRDQPEAQRR
jgi:antitoxin VapB